MKNKWIRLGALVLLFSLVLTACGKKSTVEEENYYTISYNASANYTVYLSSSEASISNGEGERFKEGSVITVTVNSNDGFDATLTQISANGTLLTCTNTYASSTATFTISQNTVVAISGVTAITRTLHFGSLMNNYYITMNDSSSVYVQNSFVLNYQDTVSMKLTPKTNLIDAPEYLYYTVSEDANQNSYYVAAVGDFYMQPVTDASGSRTFEFANNLLSSDNIQLSQTGDAVNYGVLMYNHFYNIEQVDETGENINFFSITAQPDDTIYLKINAGDELFEGYQVEGLDSCTLLVNGRIYERNEDGLFEINHVLKKLYIIVLGLTFTNVSASDNYYKVTIQNDTLHNLPQFSNLSGIFLTNASDTEQYVTAQMSVTISENYELVSTQGNVEFSTQTDSNNPGMVIYTITEITGGDILEVRTSNVVTLPISDLLADGYEVYYKIGSDGSYTQLMALDNNEITVLNNESLTIKIKFQGEYSYNYPQFIHATDDLENMFYINYHGILSQTNVLTPMTDISGNAIVLDESLYYVLVHVIDDAVLTIQ